MSGINEKVYNRILVFILGIPVSFLLIFTIVAMMQLREINSRIEEGQSQTVKAITERIHPKDSRSEFYRQFMALAVLEEESLQERYRQGHYSLVSRSFKQFLGFFTGIIMVIVGCVFILLKLKEQIDLNVSHGEKAKLALITSSPGVVFGVVGAVLIGITSTTNDKIAVRDSGLYLTREYLVAPFFSGEGYKLDLSTYMADITENDDEDSTQKKKLILQSPPKPKEKKDSNKTTTEEETTIQHPPKKQ